MSEVYITLCLSIQPPFPAEYPVTEFYICLASAQPASILCTCVFVCFHYITGL
jgi:hypothetical protein